MQIRDLIRWNRPQDTTRTGSDAVTETDGGHPLQALQRDINRVFDQFWSRFDQNYSGAGSSVTPFGFTTPRANVSDTEKAVEVSVELPGMSEKDLEIQLSDDVLVLKGEKKAEHEENRQGYYLAERSFGSFYRTIPLPPGVDTEKAEAVFKNGVLTVTLPKTPEAQAKVKKIDVKAA